MTPEALLSQLKDIHEPAAISSWPPAPGWWILIVSAICLTVLLAWLWRRHVKKNSWKKEATKTLADIKKQTTKQDHHQTLFLINQLIKRIAIHRYNDMAIKTLTGESWLEFMKSFLNGPDTPDMFQTAQLELLSAGLYQQNIGDDKSVQNQISSLLKTLNNWIKEA